MAAPLRIAEFAVGEPGQLYWLRWWDQPIRPGGLRTQFPDVIVRLDRIAPDIDWDTVQPALEVAAGGRGIGAASLGGEYVSVEAGLIPVLALGDVYRAGRRVGRLPLEKRDLIFPRRTTTVSLRCATAERPKPRSRRFRDHRDWPALPQDIYPRGDRFENAWLVVLCDAASGTVLHLPCSELFRAFYAPSTLLARALLKGPWPITANEVAEIDLRPGRSNARLGLKKGVAEHDAPFLHLLLLHETGRRAANAVDARLRHAAHKQRDSTSTDHPRLLKVDLPFKWTGRLTIGVEGFAPYNDMPDHFVGLRVRRWRWPLDRPTIHIFGGRGRRAEGRIARNGERSPVLDQTGPSRPQDRETHTNLDARVTRAMIEKVIWTEGVEITGRPYVVRFKRP